MLDEITLKPMLTTSEMIEHLKEKNIKFEQMSEKEVSKYLEDNNNYFNLTAYKNNFEKKYINKKFVDEYVDLDFAYLKDLSIIDFKLRLLLFDMIVDIEHYLKLKILRLIKNIPNEDGYAVVNKYLDNDYNDPVNPKKLHNSILKKVGNVYYQRIFSKYDMDDNKRLEDIPMWEFLEIITFGELVKFYDFFIEEYNLNYLKDEIYILSEIKKLRNAVAHNSNILTELDVKNNFHDPSKYIIEFLEKSSIFFPVQFVLLYELTITVIYTFPLLSRFNFKFFKLLKTAFLMANKHLLTTISCLILLGAGFTLITRSLGVLSISYTFPIFFVVLFCMGLYIFVSSLMFMKLFRKYVPDMDKDPEEIFKHNHFKIFTNF